MPSSLELDLGVVSPAHCQGAVLCPVLECFDYLFAEYQLIVSRRGAPKKKCFRGTYEGPHSMLDTVVGQKALLKNFDTNSLFHFLLGVPVIRAIRHLGPSTVCRFVSLDYLRSCVCVFKWVQLTGTKANKVLKRTRRTRAGHVYTGFPLDMLLARFSSAHSSLASHIEQLCQ